MSVAVPTTASDFTVATSGSASSITGNKPANVADGDLLVAWVTYRNSGTTFTPPSGWSLATSQTTGQSEAVYYKPIPSAAAETATTYAWSFTGGVGRVGVIIFRVTGANLSSPIDATGTWESGPTSSMVLPAVTAVAANAMLLAFGLALTSTTSHPVFTAPSGMTTLTQTQWDNGSASSSVWVGFKTLTATGSTGTETATLSPNASSGNGVMLTIAPASFPAPTAAFTDSTSALTVNVDGTSSTAVSPATITGYDWNWGDSTTDGTGSTASHTYASAGSYTITLTVTDSNGQTNQVTHSVTVSAASGTATAQAVTASSGWTPSSGTPLSCITDNDPTTFVTSSGAPTALEFDFQLQPMTPPASGQPLKVFLTMDRLLSTTGTLAAQLFEGSTQRSALTGVAIPTGSGSSVSGLVTLTFPWTDVQNVTTGGWNAGLTVKLQVTAS